MVARVVVRDVFATNAFFAIDGETGCGFLIDPGAEAGRLYAIARNRGWRIERILLTHGHFDHTAGAVQLARAWNVPISMHRLGEAFLADTGLNLSARCGRRVVIDEPVDWLEDGDEIRLAANGAFVLKVLHTPGHTPDSATYWMPGEGCAFAGDTIIGGGMGITDFPGGDAATLAGSIRTKILSLPADTRLFCGHSEAVSAAELARNLQFGGGSD